MKTSCAEIHLRYLERKIFLDLESWIFFFRVLGEIIFEIIGSKNLRYSMILKCFIKDQCEIHLGKKTWESYTIAVCSALLIIFTLQYRDQPPLGASLAITHVVKIWMWKLSHNSAGMSHCNSMINCLCDFQFFTIFFASSNIADLF